MLLAQLLELGLVDVDAEAVPKRLGADREAGRPKLPELVARDARLEDGGLPGRNLGDLGVEVWRAVLFENDGLADLGNVSFRYLIPIQIGGCVGHTLAPMASCSKIQSFPHLSGRFQVTGYK